MTSRLYIGNLSYQTTSESLRAAFEAGGRTVKDATVITDRETGQSRGFGFVEMGTPAEAEAALAELDGQLLDGRPLRVSEARERAPRGPGGPGGPPRGPRPPRGPGGPGGPPPRGPRPMPPDMMGGPPDDFGGKGRGRRGFDEGGGRRERERKRGKKRGGRDRGDEHDEF
jgi:cold-inducible RNA-binding protein